MPKRVSTGKVLRQMYLTRDRYHLMRAVRRPKSARSWLNSSFFIAWIVISVASFIIQFGVAWIHKNDLETQMTRMFTASGLIELLSVTLLAM